MISLSNALARRIIFSFFFAFPYRAADAFLKWALNDVKNELNDVKNESMKHKEINKKPFGDAVTKKPDEINETMFKEAATKVFKVCFKLYFAFLQCSLRHRNILKQLPRSRKKRK